ncbi:MAG TPA: aminoacyl-tRNA hydrolase [Gaiellales bacterium]|jgi:PTH1 family peptidyl-tRNA hydrolase
MDLLVAGLGNPGGRYARTRHNAGYLVAEELRSRWGSPPEREKHGGALSELRLDDGTTIALLRPLGFMNLSGGPEQIVCVHDEVELAFGQVRAKLGGGLGGHNGLRSVAERLGTRDFGRVRCGIGRQRAGDRRDLADWVLAPFEDDEDPAPRVGTAADCVELIAREGFAAALAAYP